MLILSMGRKTQTEDLVPKDEAARILKVSVRTIERMAKQGVLEVVGDGLFRLSDLSAVSEVLIDEGRFNIANLTHAVMKANVVARRAERGLEHINTLLGIDLPSLPMEQNDVIDLYLKADRMALVKLEELSAAEVLGWARTFLAITEEFLDLVSVYTSSQEPWRVFMELAKKLSMAAPKARFVAERDLAAAYGYLDLARRNLRQVAYFHVRTKKGKRFADRLLPDAELDPHERVLNLLFSF
jgi:hypothetical protein